MIVSSHHVYCVSLLHKKKHYIIDIKSTIKNLKRRIALDVEQLENIIHPKYKENVGIGNSSEQFDKVIKAIFDQEDNVCKVREIGSRLKNEAKQKRKFKQNNKEVLSKRKKKNGCSHPDF